MKPVARDRCCDSFGNGLDGGPRLEAWIDIESGFFEIDVVDDGNVDDLLSFSRGSCRGLRLGYTSPPFRKYRATKLRSRSS
jgi:hypothetical protein